MKKTKISEMTPEQAADELVFSAFEKALRVAKRKANAAQLAEYQVFKLLEDMCIDPESVPTDAENADTLADAITCYLSYDEYNVAGIMREVRGAYGNGE